MSSAGGTRAAHCGFTLQELMITLAIGGVLITGGIGMYGQLQESRLVTSVNAFVAHLSLARSEAVKRGMHVVICPSTNGTDCSASDGFNWWHDGAILFVDTNADRDRDPDEPLIHHFSASSTTTIKSSPGSSRMVYMADGMTAVTNTTFTFCDTRGTHAARYVIVSRTGRARSAKSPPDGHADAPSEACA